MKTFPWARAMEIGFGHLRLAPEEFWKMTLRELSAAAPNAVGSPQALQRDDLDGLLRRFPD